MSLEEKTILVTGSSRGIGRAIAVEAAKEGANVIVHYGESKADADAVVAEVLKLGCRVALIQADLSRADAPYRLVEKAWAAFGHVDILVCNAGTTGERVHFLDVKLDDFERVWHVNVRGAFILLQGIARLMVQRGRGHILTITSVDALRPATNRAHYAATKGALEAMTKNIALELSPHGIYANTLAVGAVETNMTAGVRNDPRALNKILQGIPLRRMASPQEIARIVCFLVSSQSTYMTGSTFLVDGGLALMRGYGEPYPYTRT